MCLIGVAALPTFYLSQTLSLSPHSSAYFWFLCCFLSWWFWVSSCLTFFALPFSTSMWPFFQPFHALDPLMFSIFHLLHCSNSHWLHMSLHFWLLVQFHTFSYSCRHTHTHRFFLPSLSTFLLIFLSSTLCVAVIKTFKKNTSFNDSPFFFLTPLLSFSFLVQ